MHCGSIFFLFRIFMGQGVTRFFNMARHVWFVVFAAMAMAVTTSWDSPMSRYSGDLQYRIYENILRPLVQHSPGMRNVTVATHMTPDRMDKLLGRRSEGPGSPNPGRATQQH